MALAECGHELRPGLRFCTVCGRPVADDGYPVPDAQEPTDLVSPPTMRDGAAGGPFGTAISDSLWVQPDRYAPTVGSPTYQAPPAQPESYQVPAAEPAFWPTQASGPGLRPALPAEPEPGFWPAPPPDPGPQSAPPGEAYWPTQIPGPGPQPVPPADAYWPPLSPGPGPQSAPPADAGYWPPAPGPQPVPPADAYWPPPSPGPGPQSAPPAGPRPREPGPGGSRKPLLFGGIAILAAGALAATFFVLRPRLFHEHPVPGSRTTPSALTLQPSSAPASAPSSAPSQEQAAASLAGLLGQSVKDRNAIVQAVNDVEQCGPNLNKDPQTLQAAAASRQNLLSQLANLPQRSALPQDMLAALTTAWQSSVEADQDFARWAQDEISRGCTQNDQSDPNAQAAVGPDQQATTSKQDFVQLWNPVASRYRLPTYRWNQL